MNNRALAKKTSFYSILSNLILASVKGLAGYFGNSYALIADAIESTADIVSSIFVMLGLKYSGKPADKDHPYGHGKIEPVITFIIVVVLVVSAILIAYESIKNIRTPHEQPKSWTLIVLSVVILWKELSFRYVNRKSKKLESTVLKADAWHHRSDAITSIAAFVGISIALIMGKGYENADDWAALCASALILFNCYKIFRPALGEIMDENKYDDLVLKIRENAIKVEGILDTEKCFVRKFGMKYYVDLHAIVDGNISVRDGHILAHKLKDFLCSEIPNLENILIHIEPFIETNK